MCNVDQGIPHRYEFVTARIGEYCAQSRSGTRPGIVRRTPPEAKDDFFATLPQCRLNDLAYPVGSCFSRIAGISD